MRRIFTLFLIGFIFICGNTKANETEPNNTRAQANTLALNGSNSGAISPAGDVDWWKVTTNANGQLNITFTSDGNNVTATLYDNNGVIVLTSGTTAGTTTISQDGIAAGIYYIELNAYYSNQTLNYTLADNLVPATVANDAEPDSSKATALTLPLNSTTTGHIDYYYKNHRDTLDFYKITINGDGLLQLKLASNNGQNVSAYLYDNDGVTPLGNVTTAGIAYLNTDGLAAGTYYVQINSYYNNQFEPYTLTDSLFKPAEANDAEPDSSKATALTLPVNSTTTGHIDYYYKNHRDTLDFYKITTNGDGLLQLKLASSNGQNVSAYLFDNDGATQLGNVTTAGTAYLNTDGLAAGTYYVQINSYYNNQFEPYTLTDSLFKPAEANDAELDSSRATALTLPVNSTTTGHIDYYYNNHRDTLDWYKITTNGDGLLQLKLTSGNGSNVSAYLLDNNGIATILGTVTTAGTAYLNTDGLAAGTYYVQINSYYNNQVEPYTLTDSLFTYNPNDTIPNKYAAQAATIPANRTVTGHTDFYYNLQRDSTDWWKINYTGTGNMNLYYNLLPNISGGIQNVTFLVYKDTATAPINSTTTASASVTVNLSSLTQGYYYIRVSTYYNNQFEAYSITDSFTQVNKATISLLKAASPNNCGGDSLIYNLGESHSPYTVRLYRNSKLFDSLTTTTDTATFTGLNDGNYYATAYGDGATDSAYSISVTTQLLPPYPTGLNANGVSDSQEKLHWNALSCVNYYIVQYRPKGSITWTTVNIANDSIILSNLVADTMYIWQVASVDSSNGQSIMSPYSSTDSFITLTALPVTFINFNGNLHHNKAILNWSTANEINNKGFEVEKSMDGQTFTGIDFVQGNGNSSIVNNYSFSDAKVSSGSNYYRLKQIDFDGKFKYSSVIRLDYSKFDWAVSGNPVTNNTWMQLQLDKTANVSVQIISINGNIIQTINKGTLVAGTYSIPLNLGNASSGMYVVRLVINNTAYSKKIIK